MRYAVLVLVAGMGCGPSASEIRSARDATYAMDARHLMQIAMDVANEQVGIAAVDPAHLTFVTKSFVTDDWAAHYGWAAKCARGGWRFEVRENDRGRAFVVITPLAQASLTECHVRWTGGHWTPSWVDVDPDTMGMRPTLEVGANKLAVAIHERANAE